MSEFSVLRQQAGLSIPVAALRLGYAERHLYRWENGEAKPKQAVLETLKALRDKKPISDVNDFKFEFIDLFAGIGGLRRGFEEIGGRCIYTSEWDKYSQLTYRANNPHDEHEISGDITKVDTSDIPAHDLLLAVSRANRFQLQASRKKMH